MSKNFISTDLTDLILSKLPPNPALKVMRLEENAKLPTKAHAGDLAYDLYALEDVTLVPGQVTKVRTGIAIGFPSGYGGIIKDRSSVATKQQVFTKAGVIDNGYTGEIIVAFFNPGRPVINMSVTARIRNALTRILNTIGANSATAVIEVDMAGAVEFKAGDKVAQMILTPVVTFPVDEVQELGNNTSRGANGFGSSGR